MFRIICLIIGYIFGCFQTAYIVGKASRGIDIREHGSGNLGTTNAFRVLGKKLGLITFAGDVLKAVAAFMLCGLIFKDNVQLAGLYAGLGAVCGHNWPFYLKFKGGKGIAVISGIMLCVNPIVTLIITAVMFAIIFITKYVSLGSILGMLSMIVFAIIEYRSNIEMLILIIFIGFIAIYKHKSNIKRLIRGKENKISGNKTEIPKEINK